MTELSYYFFQKKRKRKKKRSSVKNRCKDREQKSTYIKETALITKVRNAESKLFGKDLSKAYLGNPMGN